MIEKIMAGIGTVSFLAGAMGIAGAIENDLNPKASIIMTVVGVLIFGGIAVYEEFKDEEKNYTELKRSDINRPYFLH